MSAEESYHKTSPNSLHIPPEIWQKIIRDATDVSGVLSPELPPAFGGSSYDRDQLKKFKKSLITRRSVVRVCKTWYNLASPYLYEYVLLGRHRGIDSLRQAMKRRSQKGLDDGKQFGGGCEIGWWIKRLDVSMRDKPSDADAELKRLTYILSRLPNLTVLTFSITDQGYGGVDLPWKLFQASLACRDTLKFINWHNHNLLPSQKEWTFFLQNHPNLESVNALCSVDRNARISLNSLKMVYAFATPQPRPGSHRHAELWEMDLPNVQSAVYVPFGSSGASVVNHIFFERVGPKLQTIRVDWVSEFEQETERQEDLRITFDEIARRCLQLRRLDVALRGHYLDMFGSPTFPSSVHTFGIRLEPIQISRRVAKSLFAMLRGIVSSHPKVKTIRLLDTGNIRALRLPTAFLDTNLREFERLGVEVQDHEGRTMVAQ